MRKAYSPEIERKVIENYISGESVRDIAKNVGVSSGYVSNCVENFSKRMEKNDIDALHDFYKIIRKTGLGPDQAFDGFGIFSVMSKYDLDINQIHQVAENVLLFSKQNDLSPENLVSLCKKLSKIQSGCNVEIEDIEDYCNKLSLEKSSLEEKIHELDLQFKQTQKDISDIFKQKRLTQKQTDDISSLLKFLDGLGLKLNDLESCSAMLKNAKNQKFDLKKIIHYLNQDNSCEESLSYKQSLLASIEAKISKNHEKYDILSTKNENLDLRYKTKKEALETLGQLDKMGVDGNIIGLWKQIFDYFEIEPSEFEKQLRIFGSKEKLNRSLENKKLRLAKEITKLEKKILWLETNRDSLKLEISNGSEFCKKNLKEISNSAQAQIDETVAKTKEILEKSVKQNQILVDHTKVQYTNYFDGVFSKLNEFLEKSQKVEQDLAKLESLKPIFDLINGKFNPSSILEVVVILDKLYLQIKGTNRDKHFISSDVQRLREKLLEVVNIA